MTQPPSRSANPRTILNVANRLPVTIGDEIKKSSGGLVAALEGVSAERFSLRWIGWPGSAVPDERQGQVRQTLENDYGASPVFLSDEQAEGFYEGFANSSLWPLLHYMPSRFRYKSPWWDDYRAVNRLFADAVLESAKDGDLVWVHDYQLMLVPAMIKEARPDLRVGFFLHTPFPSYEIFRCHPRRSELLDGMLGADQIGFHTFGYLRHFRSSVAAPAGRGIRVDAHPAATAARRTWASTPSASTPPSSTASWLRRPSPRRLQEFIAKHKAGGRQVVVSVERLDYTKGILHRLDGHRPVPPRPPRPGQAQVHLRGRPLAGEREGVPRAARGRGGPRRPAQRPLRHAATTAPSTSSTAPSTSPTCAPCTPWPTPAWSRRSSTA